MFDFARDDPPAGSSFLWDSIDLHSRGLQKAPASSQQSAPVGDVFAAYTCGHP